ncbi:AraC family transcriptional regulator [Paenibacillus koleovorans]|uniref:AraC family transcriptional regulator n=1 Tax=Paenibacillus koleovorans TaxID=121608 RepID=UPI0013E359D2|nr:AraC family transcriptional regulator [Paenibacillus koleovorans]
MRYRLLDVQVLRFVPHVLLGERHFLDRKPASHRLLLSLYYGELVIDGRLHAMRPGSLFVCAPEQLIELTNFTSESFELLMLEFEVASADLAPAEEGQRLFPHIGEASIPSLAVAAHLYDTMRSNWSRGGASGRLRSEAGLLELLSLVLAHKEQQSELIFENARLELERRFREDVSIDVLAGIAGLSRFHFMRLFKERYGRSVTEYRTELRVTEAKRLLSAAKPAAIDRIVYEVGFKNEAYFNQLFRKQTGVAPGIYQRNQKRKVAAYSWVNFGQVLALRTIPFAAPMDQYWTDYYRSKYSYEVQVPLSHRYDYNYMVLEQAKPDFIVGVAELVPPEEQAKLAGIAPSLFLSSDDEWRRHLELTAELLGDPQEARSWLARYERKADKTRKALHSEGSGGEALLVLLVKRDGLQICGRRTGTVLYDDLHIPLPTGVASVKWLQAVEPQALPGFGADRVLVHVDGNEAAMARWTQLAGSAVWRRLDAVQAGRVHVAAGYSYFTSPWNDYSAYRHEQFLNDVQQLLAHTQV